MATLLTNAEILTGGNRFANALDSAGLGRRASVVELRDSLPRTETGKLLRRQVRAHYWEGRARRI